MHRHARGSGGSVPQPLVYVTDMQLGYLRVSKADGSQALDLQRDALLAAGVEAGQQDDPGQAAPGDGRHGQPDTKVAELCRELGITRQTLYRHVSPQGALRPDGDKLLAQGRRPAQPTG